MLSLGLGICILAMVLIGILGGILSSSEPTDTGIAATSPPAATPPLISAPPTSSVSTPTAPSIIDPPTDTPTPVPSATLAASETLEPWEDLLDRFTAQELLDCETTTLTRQLEGRSYPGETLSDCETAVTIAHASTLGFLHSEDSTLLSPEQHATVLEHAANLDEIGVELTGLEFTSIGVVHATCTNVPAWLEQVRDAKEYLESFNPPRELRGMEMDILNKLRFIGGMAQDVCDSEDTE